MPPASIDVYLGAFAARCEVMRGPGRREVDEPGVCGLLSCSEDPLTRLLVSDDRAYDTLPELIANTRSGMINVFAAAARCTELIDSLPA